jgi:hypothetical protein
VQVCRATAGGGSEHDAGQIADVVERRQHGRLLGGVEGADVAADLAADVGIAGAGGEAVVDDVARRCQPVPAGAVVEQGVDVVEPALGLGGDLGNGGHVGARNGRMRGMLRIPRGRGWTDVTRCGRRAGSRTTEVVVFVTPATFDFEGMRRDFPPSGNGVEAPRLVVFKVINLKPLKGEVPWSRLHEPAFEVKLFAWGSIWPSA